MLRTLKILVYMGDLITGKVGVPPAVVCESPLMQARRLLYPLFRPLLRNMSYNPKHKKTSAEPRIAEIIQWIIF